MDIVKNHPYKLCEMAGVGFKTADKIAMSMGIDRLSPERVDEGILYTLTDAESRGNLCMERDGFIAACQKTLETPELTDQMIAARANRLILDGRMRTYESCVYREKTAKAEEKLADLIRYQIRHQNPCTYGDLDHELDREESRLKVRLAPEQLCLAFTAAIIRQRRSCAARRQGVPQGVWSSQPDSLPLRSIRLWG